MSHPYHPNDSWGLEGPLQSIPDSDLGIKPQGGSELGRKSGRKPLPAVLDGMDKAEALAYVSRLFDAAQAGAAVWGDALLIKRFITQCSRTDSEATRAAYRFEIKELATALMKSSSSLVPGGLGISHAKQLEMFAGSGDVLLDSTSTHTS